MSTGTQIRDWSCRNESVVHAAQAKKYKIVVGTIRLHRILEHMDFYIENKDWKDCGFGVVLRPRQSVLKKWKQNLPH
jgi:hypothetical protein